MVTLLLSLALTVCATSQGPAASQAPVLTPGVQRDGRLTETRAVATFALEVTEAGPVTVDVRGPRFDGYLKLLDADGLVLAEDDNGWMHRHPRLVVEVAPDVSLRVEVSAVKGRTGPFVITCRAGRAEDVTPDAAVDDAIRCYEECLETLGEDSLVTAWRSRIVGMALVAAGRDHEKGAWFRRTLAIRERILGPDHVDVAQSLHNVAVSMEGRTNEAEEMLRRALSIQEAVEPEGRGAANISRSLAHHLDGAGRWSEAIAMYRRSISIRRTLWGEESVSGTGVLLELANCLGRSGRFVEAEAAARDAHEQFQRLLGEHLDTASAAKIVGDALGEQAGHEEAAEWLRRAAQMYEEVGRKGDAAQCLEELAHQLRALRRFEEAIETYREVLAARTHLFGAESSGVATCLYNVGAALMDMGRHAEAEALIRQAIALWRKTRGEENWYLAKGLGALGDVLRDQAQYTEAEACYRRSLAMREKLFGELHASTAEGLSDLAYCLRGRYAEKEALYRRALSIRERVLGNDHRDTASSANNLGYALMEQGRNAEAETHLRRALSIREAVLGERDLATAWSAKNLALALVYQGRNSEAEPYYRRAIATREALLGPTHLSTLAAHVNLGCLYLRRHQNEEAERWMRDALERYGARPEASLAKTALGLLCEAEGRFEEAERWHREVLRLEMSQRAPGHRVLCIYWNNLGSALAGLGRLEEAEEAYRRSLDPEDGAATDETLSQERRSDLALLLHRMDRGDEAVELAGQAVELSFHRTAREASLTPPELRLGLLTRLRRDVSLLATLTTERDESSGLFTLLSSVKGLTFQLASRADVGPAASPRARELHRRARELSTDLSALAYVDRIDDEEAHRARFRTLQDERRQVERELLLELEVGTERLKTSASELGGLLPDGTAFLDVIEHRPYRLSSMVGAAFDPDPNRFEDAASARLFAWIVRAGATEAVFVDLGSSGRMKALVEDGLRELAPGLRGWIPRVEDEDARDPLTALREALLDPLVPHLSGVSRLIISPDGVLSELPFEALPTGTGHRLLEQAEVVYVQDAVTLRELLEGEPAARTSSPSLLAVGGVDYESRHLPNESGTTSRGERAFSTSWGPLPETALEARWLATKLTNPDAALIGEAATEEAVKAAAPGKSILHLATHGFYQRRGLTSLWAAALEAAQEDAGLDLMPIGIGGGERETEDGDGAQDPDETRFRHARFVHLEGASPGLLTGVVLAGVNRPQVEGHDDGVLTGDEVSRLDLSACDLAVLSACETALGQTSPGEGVMSLRRSFREAGAKTVISTLWRVDDRATRELMTQFYTRLLDRKQAPGRALRGAKLHLLKNTEFQHPRYWAAFTLAGDWR